MDRKRENIEIAECQRQAKDDRNGEECALESIYESFQWGLVTVLLPHYTTALRHQFGRCVRDLPPRAASLKIS